MSNLSELLPAGAGAKSADFVASGTLGSGQVVVLKSDGTVDVVAEEFVPTSAGTPQVFSNGNHQTTATSYDPIQEKVVICYQDTNNSYYGTMIVATVSGSTLSFGPPVVFYSGGVGLIKISYDSYSAQHIVFFLYGSGGYAKLATVSGNSATFGARATVTNRLTTTNADFSVVSDTAGSALFVYQEQLNGLLNYTVATISGTSLSTGSSVSYWGSTPLGTSLVFDESIQKIIFFWGDINNDMYGVVVTLSGTSFSKGPTFYLGAGYGSRLCAAYDPIAEKTFVFYYSSQISNLAARTVTASGTTLSAGSLTGFVSNNVNGTQATYNPNTGKIVVVYRDYNNSSYGTFVDATVSGSSVSFGTAVVFESAAIESQTGVCSSSSEAKCFVTYVDKDSTNDATSSVLTLAHTGTNSADFIGITDEAIADTATGAVIVQGGVSDKVSGLTTGADYYVQADGTISATVSSVPAGRALSSTSILLEG